MVKANTPQPGQKDHKKPYTQEKIDELVHRLKHPAALEEAEAHLKEAMQSGLFQILGVLFKNASECDVGLDHHTLIVHVFPIHFKFSLTTTLFIAHSPLTQDQMRKNSLKNWMRMAMGT